VAKFVSEPDSRESYETIRNWVQECEERHFFCRFIESTAQRYAKAKPDHPARLLDVGSWSQAYVRVVEVLEGGFEYLTFSHCCESCVSLELIMTAESACTFLERFPDPDGLLKTSFSPLAGPQLPEISVRRRLISG